MDDDLTWTTYAHPNAMVARDELLEWLQCDRYALRRLVRQGFPFPRYPETTQHRLHLSKDARWRVGDVRAWLAAHPPPIPTFPHFSPSRNTQC